MKVFVVQKKICELDTWICIECTDIHLLRAIAKKKPLGEVTDNTLPFVRTIHVPKKPNNAIVITTIRFEGASHRFCSQLFHPCLQRKIGSCRDGDLRGG